MNPTVERRFRAVLWFMLGHPVARDEWSQYALHITDPMGGDMVLTSGGQEVRRRPMSDVSEHLNPFSHESA